MGLLLWLLLLFMCFVVALTSSAKLRKGFFIWLSYATITGWYYFRVLQKKYTNSNNKEGEVTAGVSSLPGTLKKTQTTPLSRPVESKRNPGLVFCEPRDVTEPRQQALKHCGNFDRSSCMSDAGSSGSSDGGSAPCKRKRRLFHSRRKAAAEDAVRCVSDASSINFPAMAVVSDPNEFVTPTRSSGTRRTYTGRKKPSSWAD